MSKFKVVEIRKMEASRMTGMTLGEDLSWREVNSDYLSFRDGVRRGRDGGVLPAPFYCNHIALD